MGIMLRLRVALGMFADRFLRIPVIKNLREWWEYRRWLRRCVAITIENLQEIYRSVSAPLPEGYSAEKIFLGDINYYKTTTWRKFPFRAVDELEQLFWLYRAYQRELEKTWWSWPDPRSELFQRFWREERTNINSRST